MAKIALPRLHNPEPAQVSHTHERGSNVVQVPQS